MNRIHNIELSRASDFERVEFYKKTYAHVAGGVLLFIIFEAIIFSVPAFKNILLVAMMGSRWTYLIILGAFMFASNYAVKMVGTTQDPKKQYLGYAFYVFLEALIFVPLLFIAMSITGSTELINQAAIITITLFAALSVIVFITKKDFSFLSSFLTVGSFIAIGVVIAGMIFGFNLGLYFSAAMCLLAGGSILYNTSNLVHKYSTNDYVIASLGLFASLMLLFYYILRILISIAVSSD